MISEEAEGFALSCRYGSKKWNKFLMSVLEARVAGGLDRGLNVQIWPNPLVRFLGELETDNNLTSCQDNM